MIPAGVLVGGGQRGCRDREDVTSNQKGPQEVTRAVRTMILRRQSPGLRPSTEVGMRAPGEGLTTGPWTALVRQWEARIIFPGVSLKELSPKS